ncbi:MAG: aminotransferase class IV, partial [Thermoanaerobaculales bacterium]|nr:aminotransferase class IV [Thermoanaerobaculales bacterium]
FKTTNREVYERARASRPDCDDVLLWNERGEVTESTIANLVARIDGELVTPPVSSGLLAGTYRDELLSRGEIAERVIRIEELKETEALYLINSVQRFRDVHWLGP